MTGIVVNGRYTRRRLTGAQRYAHELVSRLRGAEVISPDGPSTGAIGHLWEQVVLPLDLRGRVLWSPTNSGPLAVRRQVLTIHDTVSVEHPEWLNARFVAWYRWLLPRLSRRVARITTVSEFSRERIHQVFGIPREEITVIYNAASSDFRPRDLAECRERTASLGLPEGRYVLSVCSSEPRKNLRGLLSAWDLLERRLPPDITLVVVGAPGAENIFAESVRVSNGDRLRALGYVADEVLPYLYAGAHAFVYPSVYEGFGLPPIEAMACGIPTVVGDATALPEVVGDGAVQCDVRDPQALADSMERACLDVGVRADLRMRGPARAQGFSWEKSASQLQALLDGVA